MDGHSGAATGTAREVAAGRGFLDRVRSGIDILRFRAAAVDTVLDDEGAFVPALGMAALAGVAAAAGSAASVAGGVALAISYLALSLAFAGAVHLGARVVLEARADFVRFYRAFGHTYLALWLVGIPLVQALFAWGLVAWQIAATVFIAERAYRIERVQAVAVVGVPLLVALLLALLLNSLLALAALVSGVVF